jgi:cell division septation protein DedD
MISQIPDAASQRLDLSAALFDPAVANTATATISAAGYVGRNGPKMEYAADFEWQECNPRHREVRLHPAALIVLVNLGVVALGLTASCGLVSLSAEQPPEITTPDPQAMTARPAAPPVQAAATPIVTGTPPSFVPDQKPGVQSPAPPARLARLPSIPKIADRTGYVLQLGAFADPAGAVRMQKDLKKRGYPTVLASSSDSGKTLRLVRIDGFLDRNEAARTAETLQSRAGIRSIIMKAHNP